MDATPQPSPSNVEQVVPFLRVSDMLRSIRFYCDGLGFLLKNKWVVDDELRWCWLNLGNASIMLQTFAKQGQGAQPPGVLLGGGVSLCFQCKDALEIYHQLIARGIEACEPFVGNSMWVTNLTDPDGYRLEFESPTTAPEETKFSDYKP